MQFEYSDYNVNDLWQGVTPHLEVREMSYLATIQAVDSTWEWSKDRLWRAGGLRRGWTALLDPDEELVST